MRKKLHVVLLNLMIMLAVMFVGNASKVFAREISGVWELSSSQTISSETINLDNIVNTADDVSAIHITSNSNIVLDGVTLQFGNSVDADQLIKVDTGCTLELNNVRMIASDTQSIGIVNNGIIKINGLYLENITSGIINNSSVTDSVQIYKSNNPLSITLNQGYVSVYETTKIAETITLDMGDNEFVDTMIGKILVKGRNTLASFYENKFVLNNTPLVSSFDSPDQYLEYLQTNQPYMMDHVGDIGDDLALADDGYNEAVADGVVILPKNLESGDLIFTKFINYLRKSGVDGQDIYISAKYATAEKFIEITKSTYLARPSIASIISLAIEDRYLNNYHTLKGSKVHAILQKADDPITDMANINIDVYAGGTKINALSKNIDIISGGSKAVFIDIDGYEFDEITTSKSSISILSNIQNARFIRPIIAVDSGVTSGTVRVDLISLAPAVTNVNIALEQSAFTYAKTNYISQVKPYYTLNEEKVYLADEEYTIYNSNSQEVTSMINADTYTIECVSTNDAIEFNDNDFSVVINPKTITLSFNNTFTYDGTAKSVTATVNGGEAGDQINVSFANNTRTLPGTQDVVVSIDNENYILDINYRSTTLTINKITIDMSNVKYEDLTFTYDGNEHEHLATNIPAGVSVTYENNKHTNVKQGDVNYYLAKAKFSVDEDYYNPLTVTELTCKIIVNKAIIDTNDISYDNYVHVYDGNEIELTIADELPTGIKKIEYTNNKHTNYSEEPYLARATFVIDDAYANNYVIEPAYKEATLTINKAYVDFSNFKFEDKTIEYDTNAHRILATGYDSELIELEYSSSAYTDVGEYQQNIILTLIDTANYYALTDAETNRSATLTIIKATINMDGISLDDRTTTYNGESHSILVSGNVSHLTVSYKYYLGETLLTELPINAGTYIVEAAFVVNGWSQDNYEKIDTKTATLIINKAIIDTSMVTYEDIYHQYDGSTIKHTVSGTLPSAIYKINYTNNVQTTYRSDPYIATAVFVLKDEYKGNYIASPSSLTSKIYITQAVVDFTNFKFEDKTVMYDGKSHSITATGLDASEVRIEYLSESHTNIGTYTQEIRITLRDVVNYAPIPEDKSYVTATLKIIQAKIDITGITFESQTFNYLPNTPRELNVIGSVDNVIVTYKYYDSEGRLLNGLPIDSGIYDVYAYFSVDGWTEDLYEEIPYMHATLTINKIGINFTYVTLNSQSFVYDGNPHSLTLNNMPYTVTYDILNNVQTNVGDYNVVVNVNYDIKNYYLINYTPLTAVLSITQATIDMSSIKFESQTYEYDGATKMIEITGTLPKFVSIKEYGANSRKDVGTSNAYVSFNVSNSNYKLVDSMACQLTITPKPVTISLMKDSFTYVGEPITVDVYATGVIDGDSISIQLLNAVNTNAGVYYASVASLGNANYAVKGSTSLRYEIKKADFDMTGISFTNTQVVYDGHAHSPSLTGTVPNGLIFNIVGGNKTNAGEYDVYCEFALINSNYNLPSPMQTKFTINKRPILVTFANYTGLIADGTFKGVDVSFVGVIETNFDGYTLSYSNTPINAGIYSCTVELKPNSNYTILNNRTITYEILTSTMSYTDQLYDMIVEGDGFSADTTVSIVESNSADIEPKISAMHVKKYKAFEISVDDESMNEEIDVTLSIRAFSVENVKYLKLYKLESGKLKEIDYVRDNGKLKFTANTNDQIILIEELTEVDKNQVWIYLIISLAIVSFMIMLSISIVYIMSKKRYK